ncbi:MAG: vitamin K epoxide reductase family protein [Solirubrobacterales bacterium]|nr:vitamin K epoxide reductase family protein [Solirubrobacterales bacterium]MCB8915082.1 vitamin K epoxide reductase family protein [Thermoleophilales bacterium]
MLSDQRLIISRNIPIEIGALFIVFGLAVIGLAIWGYRTPGPLGENRLRITAGVLTVLGLGVAGYIAYKTQIINKPFQCVGGGGGCELVEKSKYANFLGVHMSIWGLIGYTTILGATIWKGDNARLAAFGLSLFGFAVSLVLRYLELWEIGAACQWCWASAVLMTSLLIVNSCRLIGYYGTDEAGGPDSGEPAVEMPATDEPEPNPAS